VAAFVENVPSFVHATKLLLSGRVAEAVGAGAAAAGPGRAVTAVLDGADRQATAEDELVTSSGVSSVRAVGSAASDRAHVHVLCRK
jgi:hypothetical protein